MFCVHPKFFSRFGYVPCGKCEGCKIAKKKEVSDRLILEKRYHNYNYFVTLTYRPEIQPLSVIKDDLIKFNKRLAYYCDGMPQFYAVGEYGDESALAHYHLCLFSDKDIFNEILKSWEFGRVGIEHMTNERCKYIAGYVAKKMNKPDDPRLYGREPEFRMSSRRPALAWNFTYDLLKRMVTDANFLKLMLSHVYPPYSVLMAGKKVMLPQYVRTKIRPLYDVNEEEQKVYKSQKIERDRQVFEKIRQNVQRMLVEELKSNVFDSDWRIDDKLFELREQKNQHLKKVSELKKKRKL